MQIQASMPMEVLKEKTRYDKTKTTKKVAKAVISTRLDILPTAFTQKIANQPNYRNHSRLLVNAIS
jgi:hypothetical protein